MRLPVSLLLLALNCLVAGSTSLHAQSGMEDRSRFPTWLPYQGIPNLVFYNTSAQATAGLEWEFAPLLYAWGMNKKISPWFSFIVVPTARFSGSVEWNIAVQAYAGKVGRSHLSASTHVMSYVPLADKGELMGLNLGLGTYTSPDGLRLFKVVGFSSAFGMLHLNVKHADRPTTWITSLDIRIY